MSHRKKQRSGKSTHSCNDDALYCSKHSQEQDLTHYKSSMLEMKALIITVLGSNITLYSQGRSPLNCNGIRIISNVFNHYQKSKPKGKTFLSYNSRLCPLLHFVQCFSSNTNLILILLLLLGFKRVVLIVVFGCLSII